MTHTVPITDLDLDALRPYRQLTAPKGSQGPMVVEGLTALERLVAADLPLISVLTTPDALPRLDTFVPPDVTRWVAAPNVLRTIVGFAFHRGALGLAARPLYVPPTTLRTVVVGERLADPGNVGALIRNACALGADAVWLDDASADPFSRRAIRAAMGWCFQLPVLRTKLVPALQALKRQRPALGVVAASCQVDAVELPAMHWPAECALLVGNEGFGLSAELIREAHAHVRIPMHTRVDSLNVAAATAILLYARSQV